jgi:hypothetical protein
MLRKTYKDSWQTQAITREEAIRSLAGHVDDVDAALREIAAGARIETPHVLIWDDATYLPPRPRRRRAR